MFQSKLAKMSKDFKGVLEVRTEVTYFVVVIMNNKKYSRVYYKSHFFFGEKNVYNKKINVFRLSNSEALESASVC